MKKYVINILCVLVLALTLADLVRGSEQIYYTRPANRFVSAGCSAGGTGIYCYHLCRLRQVRLERQSQRGIHAEECQVAPQVWLLHPAGWRMLNHPRILLRPRCRRD